MGCSAYGRYEQPLCTATRIIASEKNNEVASRYVIRRLGCYSLAMLLGFAVLIDGSDVIDHLYSTHLIIVRGLHCRV